MNKHLDMSVLTVGQVSNGNSRIWIASTAILKSHNIGDSVLIEYNKELKEVVITQAEIFGNHTVSSRNQRDPIIDIKNQKITEMYKPGEKIEVLYYSNKIVIKVAKAQLAQNERKEKEDLTFFDFFAGAGTLSSMVKKAGFKPVGALECSEQYISMYRSNHGEDVYTIAAKIEDILPEDLLKDVSMVTVGLPCTSFSQGNKVMMEELKKMREGKEYDPAVIAKRYEGEALTFYALRAILAMNPRTVIFEEVEPYSRTDASMLLRTILAQAGYHLTETVEMGSNTKRKRFCLVAHMNHAIDLTDLMPKARKTIGQLLETPIADRLWQTPEENKRVSGMIRKGLGIRCVMPDEVMVNSFTTHGTRHTEPLLKHPTKELYSEFTNQEIANIHGLEDFKLSGEKTLDRQILGQGVTDMFYEVALRIMDAYAQEADLVEAA